MQYLLVNNLIILIQIVITMDKNSRKPSTIVVHSHKGGSGKTLLSINLAALLVNEGKRVAVIDLDMTAPSLQTYALEREGKYLNDYLSKDAQLEDVIFDATYILDTKVDGKLFMMLSDVSGDAISKLGQRTKDVLIEDLYLLMDIVKNQLPKDPYNIDYIIVDTSPGLSTASINGVALADMLIVLMKLSNADIDGSYHFLKTIHRVLKPNTKILVNQIPQSFLDKNGLQQTETLLNREISDKIDKGKIEFLGIIEFDGEIIEKELEHAFEFSNDGKKRARPIHYLINQDGIFSNNLKTIRKQLIPE
jgi:MinD-like ATPase involved in chromosome partitioning or flagellar assembly